MIDPDKKSMLQKMLYSVEKTIENLENAVKLDDKGQVKEYQEVWSFYIYY